jgi:hypothetical protein
MASGICLNTVGKNNCDDDDSVFNIAGMCIFEMSPIFQPTLHATPRVLIVGIWPDESTSTDFPHARSDLSKVRFSANDDISSTRRPTGNVNYCRGETDAEAGNGRPASKPALFFCLLLGGPSTSRSYRANTRW